MNSTQAFQIEHLSLQTLDRLADIAKQLFNEARESNLKMLHRCPSRLWRNSS
jgi:hypothetical protein